ncbi:hypothetical protein AADR41_01315 [Streptomyces sp. CLV115]|uniref:hypothetical protein n=1 Tax=Streptomyces sp. CLV115 TaxID=3138502 RepID=UPI00313ACA59
MSDACLSASGPPASTPATTVDRPGGFGPAAAIAAPRARDDGFDADLVLPADGPARDEGIRPGTGPGNPAAPEPSFRPDTTITAGNAAPPGDAVDLLD